MTRAARDAYLRSAASMGDPHHNQRPGTAAVRDLFRQFTTGWDTPTGTALKKWEFYSALWAHMDRRHTTLREIKRMAPGYGVSPDVIAMRRRDWLKMRRPSAELRRRTGGA